MSNLIVTVISIALVAVAALMGAYYGGAAYMEGMAKAQANQLIEGAKQITGAWTMYANDNGGSYTLNATGSWGVGGSPIELVPRYLNNWPSFCCGPNPYFQQWKLNNDGTFSAPSVDANYLIYRATPLKVCEQINLIAAGSKTMTSFASFAAAGFPNSMFAPFRCFSANSPLNFFIYRVF